MTTADIQKFLEEADKQGYANPDATVAVGYDGGHLIEYIDDAWHYRDLFYGGEPYAGQEVIYYQDKAVWAMQYRGWLQKTERPSGHVYAFLRHALSAGSRSKTYRGPAKFTEDMFRYANSWSGGFENFEGQEQIYDGEQLIYQAKYMGGLVDLPEQSA